MTDLPLSPDAQDLLFREARTANAFTDEPVDDATTDVLAAEAVTYRPIREFTGWGIRWRPGWGWAYSVAGNRGLRVDLRNGSHLMIGSRAPEPLAEAVRMVRGQDTGRPW